MRFEAKPYRAALGAFATGVAVVSARGPDGRASGLTVNSFTSVSLDPPLVLWCLGDKSDSWDLFSTCEAFAISILPAEAEALAMRFAGKGDQSLVETECAPLDGGSGAPALRGALTRLDCRVERRVPAGDHLVLIGEVLAWDSRPGPALTYHRGAFGRIGD